MPAVVLLTTGVSDDSMLTRQAAFELQGEATTIFSVATDAALLRGPVRRQELMAMGSLYDAAFDSDSDTLDRRLLETPISLLDLVGAPRRCVLRCALKAFRRAEAPLLAQDLVVFWPEDMSCF